MACWRTHLQLLHSPLQRLSVQGELLGGQLLLRRLKPSEEGAREPAEVEQLLLASQNGRQSAPGRG